jgi:COP9 signalosome complex subunit 4
MENLTRTINTAIQSNNYAILAGVFSDFGSNSWQTVGQGEQRSLAAHFIHAAVTAPSFLPAAFGSSEINQVMVVALGHLPATVEQAADNTLRQKLFEYMVNQEDPDYSGAARILGGMRMEDDAQSVYYMQPAARTDVFVKIAECFLAEDEISESDAAVQKAGQVVENIPDKELHTALILRYKSTYARVLDANRKFLQAAQRYHELSQSATDLIDADDLLNMLGRAATCAILAPSGPQRQRVLRHIYKDTRLRQLDGLDDFQTHSTILKKMYTHQVLRPDELTKFEASLADHQQATMGDGLTIMERGVVEHNMIAVSNLYRTIYVKELARILGVDERKAEKTAASMILAGSLHGSIDQVEGLLEFEPEESSEQTWDRSITSFCIELNLTVDAIKAGTQ